ncbi:MAG: Rqc2 family fibronectin-binding protein [Candidatus Caldatribacteriaceae bacterium]
MKILEGLPLRFLQQEIEPKLRGSRIQKATFNPKRQETWFELFTPTGRQFLVIACHPEASFLFLTSDKPLSISWGQSTQWTQILHKYLVGGRIVTLEQLGWDRVLRLTVENPSLWQEENKFLLVIELTGRNTNCILTRKNSELSILGVYRKVTPENNRFRTLFPGSTYIPPPQKEKINPFDLIEGQVSISLPEGVTDIKKWVIDHIDGIGPFLGKILAQTWSSENTDLAILLSKLVTPLAKEKPPLLLCFSSPYESPQGICWKSELYFPDTSFQNFSSWNEVVQTFYNLFWQAKEREIQEKTRRRKMQEELEFLENEIQRVQSLLYDPETIAELKMKGELLKMGSSLQVLSEKEDGILVQNPFTGGETFISLCPSLNRTQNMQRYFQQYRKALTRNKKLLVQLKNLKERKEKVLQDAASFEEQALPYHKISPRPSRSFRKFRTEKGSSIWIGKNQKDNQKLLQDASREDYWLHARDLPGAHVILKLSSPEFQEEEIKKAAQLAGYFSMGKNDSWVEVIVTQVKHLHSIPKTTGKVTFRYEKTILVRPAWPKGIKEEL